MEERPEQQPASAPAHARGGEAKEEGGGQARKGPRRRGRRGGRRCRSGQRPQQAPGEEGPAEGRIETQGERGAPTANDANNNGRGAAREEEAPARGQAREAFASAVEPEPSREAPADIQGEPEPPRALIELDNIVLTPHMGGWSPEALDRSVRQFIDNAARHFAGEPVLTPV